MATPRTVHIWKSLIPSGGDVTRQARESRGGRSPLYIQNIFLRASVWDSRLERAPRRRPEISRSRIWPTLQDGRRSLYKGLATCRWRSCDGRRWRRRAAGTRRSHQTASVMASTLWVACTHFWGQSINLCVSACRAQATGSRLPTPAPPPPPPSRPSGPTGRPFVRSSVPTARLDARPWLSAWRL